jgi:hypothetical protein
MGSAISPGRSPNYHDARRALGYTAVMNNMEKSERPLLTAHDGRELVGLLDELKRTRPLARHFDNVSFCYDPDGIWRLRYGAIPRVARARNGWVPTEADPVGPGYSTLVEALRAAVEEYREHPGVGPVPTS